MTLPRVARPPQIDGMVAADEYSFGATGFMELRSGAYATEERQTKYWLAYDNDGIYLAVDTPVMAEHQAKKSQRDDPVYTDDCIELYLAVNPTTPVYYQFVINSAGGLFDAKEMNPFWNAKQISHKSLISNHRWTMEVAIPFVSLGVPTPGNGETWKMTICRSFTYPEATYTSISPLQGTYHNPAKWNILRFQENAPWFKLSSLGDLALGKLDFSAHMWNPIAQPVPIQTTLVAESGQERSVDIRKEGELSSKLDLPVAVAAIGTNGVLTVTVNGKEPVYKARFPYKLPAQEPAATVEYIYTTTDAKSICLGLHLPLVSANNPAKLSLRLLAKNVEAVVKEMNVTKGRPEINLDISNLNPADYDVTIDIHDQNGRMVGHLKDTYRKYPVDPPWKDDKIGVNELVPAPWTPMEVKGDSIYCWGRRYEFNKGLFPSQITSQETRILSSPIQLNIQAQGAKLQSRDLTSSYTEKSGGRVIRSATGKYGSLTIGTEFSVEYDGFSWCTLTLMPQGKTELNSLDLRIPFQANCAMYRNFGDYRLERTGLAPAEEMSKNLLKDQPLFWFGNGEVGLQWFAESLRGWRLDDWNQSLQVTQANGVLTARLNIIGKPFCLNEKHTITFGIQATPVKTPAPNWRDWRFRPWGSKASWNVEPWFTEWTRFMNHPDLGELRPKAEQINEFHRQQKQVMPYLALAVANPKTAEYKFYGEFWRNDPMPFGRIANSSSFDPQGGYWQHEGICPNSKSYRDFYLWKIKPMVEEMPIGGLYFDCAAPSPVCRNKTHGCYWEDEEGLPQNTYAIRGMREMAKRVYVLMKIRHPDSIILHHMSGRVLMPVHAFADVLLDGENLATAIGNHQTYYSVLPLDKYRAEYANVLWGPTTMMIPQFKRSADVLVQPEKKTFYDTLAAQKCLNHFIGLNLVHDSLFWPIWGVKPDDTWKAMDRFGWDANVKFIPYWKKPVAIELLDGNVNEEIVVSVFTRPGKLMMVPFNNTDNDRKLSLTFDPHRYGLTGEPPLKVTEALVDKPLVLGDNRLLIEMPAREFKMIIVENTQITFK